MASAIPGLPVRPDLPVRLAGPAQALPEVSTVRPGHLRSMRIPIEGFRALMAAAKPLDLPLRCRCGYTRGVASDVSPSSGFRFVCYCKDCQAFARFLDSADVLDPAGGTDIFHLPPARVRFTAGADAMRCLSFS